ncbi:hypothetical protein K493DRAFT_297021 [Basidiobolus meristosporus CBS 931.73]|uniref:Uncharacterized protein n=1 Tax=Basidiobolus meristosporus CBS 931.73 TaxID=1314790 RepID=A0A1Y1Z2A2_9FUNG|nr:hypothetical protein K493DRAFT_297021 [Basidiobolus meristosporus CBS 931.73]|eukprot:ORY04316.1 hypothetical protein K493DRAFT_297021 [Basidiobolus meristosporus CBS 931.73]
MKISFPVLLLAVISQVAAAPIYGSGGNGSISYCDGLVVQLNALGAGLNAKVCTGKSESAPSKYKDADKLSCNNLVVAVQALGINVNAGLCKANDKEGSYTNPTQPEDPHASPAPPNDSYANPTPPKDPYANAPPPKDPYSGPSPPVEPYTSPETPVDPYDSNGGQGGTGSSPTCQDVLAKVKLLGIKVDAGVCASANKHGSHAPVLSGKSGCPTLVANAKLLGIVNVDLAACLKAKVNV